MPPASTAARSTREPVVVFPTAIARVCASVTPMFPTIGYQSPPALPDRQIPERPATSTFGCAQASASGTSVISAGVELVPPSMSAGRLESHHGDPDGPPTVVWTCVGSLVTELHVPPPSAERTIVFGVD